MRRSFRLFAYLVVLFVAAPLSAQPPIIGVTGGYHYIWNTSQMPILAGSTDCGTFSNGTSNGFYGGLTFGYPFLDGLFEASAAVTYSSRPASLTARSSDNAQVLDPTTNTYVPFVRDNMYEAKLGYVMVDLGIRIHPLQDLPFYIRVGGDAGNPIVSSTFVQTEQVVSPDAVLFPGGLKQRVVGSGEIPQTNTSYGVSGTLGAEFMLSKNVSIAPEISYRRGLNSIAKNTEWSQSFASGGIHLRYRLDFDEDVPPPPAPPPPPPPPLPPPALKPPPIVVAAVVVPPVIIQSLSTQPLEINETVVTQTFPLLPYLFFDSASSAVRSRYVSSESTAAFAEQALPKQTLPIYYRMLDIVGKRMKTSQAKLVVTGTTDGMEGGTAEGRKKLAEERAKAVVLEMRKRWGLEESRFVLRAVEKPTVSSNDAYAEGVAENRKVELSSTDATLLAPVVHTRFNEYVPVLRQHDFTVTVKNPELAGSWVLNVRRAGVMLGTKSGPGQPPPTVTFDLTQEITDKIGPVMGLSDTLEATMTIQQTNGEPVESVRRFAVNKSVSTHEVSRLSLIVFDFDQSTISDVNRDMMKKVIASSARPTSVATIKGSTDKLGELAHNMDLSAARAQAVEQYLRSSAPFVKIESVSGIGPSELPYDNSLPEGRYYCRTVSLFIKTPLLR